MKTVVLHAISCSYKLGQKRVLHKPRCMRDEHELAEEHIRALLSPRLAIKRCSPACSTTQAVDPAPTEFLSASCALTTFDHSRLHS